ncbi:hypothetical protein D3C73_814080 [compost metagenome]
MLPSPAGERMRQRAVTRAEPDTSLATTTVRILRPALPVVIGDQRLPFARMVGFVVVAALFSICTAAPCCPPAATHVICPFVALAPKMVHGAMPPSNMGFAFKFSPRLKLLVMLDCRSVSWSACAVIFPSAWVTRPVNPVIAVALACTSVFTASTSVTSVMVMSSSRMRQPGTRTAVPVPPCMLMNRRACALSDAVVMYPVIRVHAVFDNVRTGVLTVGQLLPVPPAPACDD